MSNNEESTSGGCLKSVGGLFWLANLIYTCMYWGGWAIFWNIFVPYAMIWDACIKFGHYLRPGQ